VTLATVIVRPLAAKIDRMIMAEIGRKLGVIVRVLWQQLRRSRTGAAVIKGFTTTARSFAGVLHQLFLEVTGFTFLAVAAIGSITAFREYGKYHARQAAGPGRLILAICFTASFAWFGVSSFLRLRRGKKA
jgi:hypothetical protein